MSNQPKRYVQVGVGGRAFMYTEAAANQSMANNRPFRIAELCQNIGLPDYPAMPTGDENE